MILLAWMALRLGPATPIGVPGLFLRTTFDAYRGLIPLEVSGLLARPG
jgi:hypothetical protein